MSASTRETLGLTMPVARSGVPQHHEHLAQSVDAVGVKAGTGATLSSPLLPPC